MHDPKFEKAVQQKMHDLEFVPSESVWENIQREVAPRRRRRALAAFWWWLVPGFVLLGTGVALYRHSGSSVGAVAVSGARPAAVPEGGSAGGTGANGSPAAGTGSPATGTGFSRAGGGVDPARSDRSIRAADRLAVGGGRPADRVGTTDRLAGSAAGTERSAGATAGSDGLEEGAVGKSSGRAAYRGYQPGLISCIVASVGIHAPRLYPKPVNTVVSGLPLPKRPWMAGFAGGAGVSSIQESSAGKLVTSASFMSVPGPYTSLYPNTTNYTIVSSAKRYSSTSKPDLSYWAGVFAEKPLSARWSVDLGLNLHYYSTRLYATQVANNYAPTAATLLTASAITYTTSNTAPASGGEQSYTNRYYYLELPVAAQWQVNQSRKVPIFWRGGVVLSYLMASDALYYDDLSGSYYRDNSVARKVQASVASGLMVGLPIRSVRIQVGPEVQYGLTSMLSTGSSSSHLFYGGMRVALLR